MKRFFKVIGLLVGIGVALVLVAALLLRIFLPPEKAKTLIQNQLTAKLHREVKLGAVSVGALSGLQVSDFSISEAPNFSKGTFISSEKFIVRLRLLPLLFKKIYVKDVELVKPHISVIRFADGKTYNFSDLGASSASAADRTSPPAKSDAPLNLLVSRASISLGQLNFRDESPAHQSIKIDHLDLKIKNFSLNAPVDLQTSFRLESKGIPAAVEFAGGVNLNGGAKIRHFSVANGETKISASGEIGNLAQTDPTLSLTVEFSKVQPKLLESFELLKPGQLRESLTGKLQLTGTLSKLGVNTETNIGALGFTAEGMVTHAATTPNVQLKWGTNEFQFSDVTKAFPAAALPADVKLSGPLKMSGTVNGGTNNAAFTVHAQSEKLDLAYADSFHKPANVPIKFDMSGHYKGPDTVDIKELNISMGGVKISGEGQYKLTDPSGTYRMKIKSESFSLGELAAWVPAFQPYSLGGQGKLTANVASGSPDLSIEGLLNLSNGSLKYEAAQLSKLAASITLGSDSVSIPKLTGLLDGKNLTATLNAKKIKTHPIITADLNADAIDLTKLLPNTSPPNPKKSDAGWLVAVAYAAAPPTTSFSSLPMDISGRLRAGVVKHEYLTAENLDVKWNLTDVTPDLSKVNGTATLKNGKGQVTNLQKLMADSKAAKILFMPLSLLQKISKATGGKVKMPALDKLAFDDVIGEYTFKSGLMTIGKFILNSKELSANMTGNVGLAGQQPVDLKAVIKLAAGLVGGGLGEALQDEQGRVPLNMKVGGTVNDPKVSLDSSATTRQAVDVLKKEVGEEKVQELQKMFKGLFKK